MPLFSTKEILSEGRTSLVSGFVSPAGVVAWLLKLGVLTTPGLFVTGLAVASLLLAHSPERPWVVLTTPFLLVWLAFVGFVFGILSVFTDFLTAWAFERLIGPLNPQRLLHRIVYFSLSLPAFVLVGIVLG